MPNGDVFDIGVYESPPISPFEEPAFLPTDPDIALGGFATPFVSTSDVLRDRDAGIPDTPYGNTPSQSWDWSQIGDTFQRAGQVIGAVATTGRDIAAIATGRTPPTVTAQQQASINEARSRQSRTLLMLALIGGGAWLFLRRRGRR